MWQSKNTIKDALTELKERILGFECIDCSQMKICAQGAPIAQFLGSVAVQLDEIMGKADPDLENLLAENGMVASRMTASIVAGAITGAFIGWFVGDVVPKNLVKKEGVMAALIYELDRTGGFDWEKVMNAVNKRKERGGSGITTGNIKKNNE